MLSSPSVYGKDDVENDNTSEKPWGTIKKPINSVPLSTMELLDSLVDRGNTVIVIEHNLDVMKQADWLIDVGPDGGTAGGEIVFSGTPKEMAEHACTITAEYLRKSM